MPWVRVPPENHPIFRAALPGDSRVETIQIFGGVAAKVNGNVFAGLFGRSTMVLLSDADKEKALGLEGASLFDPMGDGRVRSDKVMLPEAMMRKPSELRRWIAKAFAAAAELPAKTKKAPARKAAKAAPAKTPKAAPARKASKRGPAKIVKATPPKPAKKSAARAKRAR
jgi:hypothetical protein